jgi:hypothetical protein
LYEKLSRGVFILKISEQIEKTYKDFEVFFKEELNLDLKKLDMSEVRDKFKELVLKDDPIFTEDYKRSKECPTICWS